MAIDFRQLWSRRVVYLCSPREKLQFFLPSGMPYSLCQLSDWDADRSHVEGGAIVIFLHDFLSPSCGDIASPLLAFADSHIDLLSKRC